MSMDQRVVIISGASGGLGQDVSKAFHSAGARVVLLGSQPDGVGKLASELSPGAASLAVDLTDESEARRAVDFALGEFGRVDAVLNLAGGFAGGAGVAETQLSELDRLLDLNLRTALHLSLAAVPAMRERRWGRIVFIGSRDAWQGRRGYAFYAISKSALLRLAESMAAELREDGILVNALIPGTIDTAANRRSQPDADFSKWVQPASIARALLFLAGDDSAISGATVPVLGAA